MRTATVGAQPLRGQLGGMLRARPRKWLPASGLPDYLLQANPALKLCWECHPRTPPCGVLSQAGCSTDLHGLARSGLELQRPVGINGKITQFEWGGSRLFRRKK